jgi:pilus assembly protein CpaE
LRNSNRLISQFFTGPSSKLEIVINRYEPRSLGVADEHITKALTRPAQWKIPNDYPAVRKMQINAAPLVLGDSPIARLIKQMARAATGQADLPAAAKKKGFSLFG